MRRINFQNPEPTSVIVPRSNPCVLRVAGPSAYVMTAMGRAAERSTGSTVRTYVNTFSVWERLCLEPGSYDFYAASPVLFSGRDLSVDSSGSLGDAQTTGPFAFSIPGDFYADGPPLQPLTPLNMLGIPGAFLGSGIKQRVTPGLLGDTAVVTLGTPQPVYLTFVLQPPGFTGAASATPGSSPFGLYWTTLENGVARKRALWDAMRYIPPGDLDQRGVALLLGDVSEIGYRLSAAELLGEGTYWALSLAAYALSSYRLLNTYTPLGALTGSGGIPSPANAPSAMAAARSAVT